MLSITVIGGYLYQVFSKKEFKYFNKKALLYIFLVFAIGSGLIVNAYLKNNFGRARPSQIVQFGGSKKFTRACVISNQCKKNCSFTCGHCSFAFGFLCLYFLFRKKSILYLALGYGIIVSIVRIAQGGHFLSDSYFSFIIMFLTAKILYYFMYEKKSYQL